MQTILMLFAAGLLAGTMNALAGGGTFVALPTMIAAGLPSVIANASTTVALWPGAATGALGYRNGFRPVCGVRPWPLLAATMAGGGAGGLLLLLTPSSAFDVLLPWLLLLATLTMAFGRRLGAALRGRLDRLSFLILALQFALGLYGGYFGGAVGLMMLAAWSLFGENDLKLLHGPRMLLVASANSVALLAFVFAGAVSWPSVFPMLLGGILGGFGGARLGAKLPSAVVRVVTITATAAITAAFFWRAYLK